MQTVNNELLDIITDVVGEENIRYDYSGRGMFGSQCFGFTTNNVMGTFGEILDAINDSDNNFDLIYDLSTMMKNASTDNIAYQTIVYFPMFTVEE